MASNTPNLGLIKPAPEDYYNIDIFNFNFDKIDEVVGDMEEALDNINTLLDEINGE